MKLVIYNKNDSGPPIAIETASRVRVMIGKDHFELREQDGLLVRIEEHDGGLAGDLAVFPTGGNSVRLKGGLR